MDRENFVGVIIGAVGFEGREPEDYILSSFAGEGNTAVVFGVAPLRDPANQQWVMKFFKPDARFEMTVLHHSFRIAEKLFPNHPLLMPADERMRRLTDEMLTRIESEGSLFRVDAYRDMLTSTIELLARQFSEPFQAGNLTDDFLTEFTAITCMVDESLAVEIESLLDDDGIEDAFQPFFEHCVTAIRKAVATAKQNGTYHPLSHNRLFKLFGLHLEDFISWDELLEITGCDRLRDALTVEGISDLGEAVSILHFRAVGKKDALEAASDEEHAGSRSKYEEPFSAATKSARYMYSVAAKYQPSLPHLAGYAKYWLAQTLLLEGKRDEAVTIYEEALEILTTDESMPERHDTLSDLAALVADSDPKRAQAYAREAYEIRQRLQQSGRIPGPNET